MVDKDQYRKKIVITSGQIFSRYGFKKTTMDEIAKELKMGKSSVYYYFKSKEDIFEYAWDEPYMGETKTLDVHISNIRKKIKTVTPDEYIETIWGIGYRLHE